MKYSIQAFMYKFSIILEIIVGLILMGVIGITIINLVLEISSLSTFDSDTLLNFLEDTMSVIIGIEFLKLIFTHTVDSAVEIMLLAIVRVMILNHTSEMNILLSVIAVAILFLTRKYLFIKELDTISDNGINLFRSIFCKNKIK